MNPNRRIEPEKIHILTIKTISGNISTDSKIDSKNVKNHKFNFNLESGFSEKEKIIGLVLTIDITGLNSKGEELNAKGSYTHELIFKIENMDDFIGLNTEDKTPELDWLLLSTVASIAYSTIRGIIYLRTQGTPLNAVILPVADPKKIIGLT
ncbi:hypothetical protein [Ferruginibacter albus]|uniref:hypothetical protein n=1 Tax=Ferruginibacter albus TaxID=2875540 RepID=UPI001CC656D6|nr:hypothetical protein [Ferruginibacter albus]UAY52734.1 hypothetical protein K9M53_03340 [Ferruginibacter albus]